MLTEVSFWTSLFGTIVPVVGVQLIKYRKKQLHRPIGVVESRLVWGDRSTVKGVITMKRLLVGAVVFSTALGSIAFAADRQTKATLNVYGAV